MLKLLFVITLCFAPAFSSNEIEPFTLLPQEQAEPPYAKWGQVAMKATKEKYPNAAIIDYLHVGVSEKNGIKTEKFKLWLRGQDKEFGVFIDIRFNSETEEVIEMTFRETDR